MLVPYSNVRERAKDIHMEIAAMKFHSNHKSTFALISYSNLWTPAVASGKPTSKLPIAFQNIYLNYFK